MFVVCCAERAAQQAHFDGAIFYDFKTLFFMKTHSKTVAKCLEHNFQNIKISKKQQNNKIYITFSHHFFYDFAVFC